MMVLSQISAAQKMVLTDGRFKISAVVSSRLLAVWEIVSVIISALIGEWVVLSFFSRYRWMVIVPLALALGLMILSHLVYRETPKDLGFRLDNFWASFRVTLIPTIAVLILMPIFTWVSGFAFTIRPLQARLLLLPVWALFQQYALQSYINRRMQIVMGQNMLCVLIVALIFAFLHLPNPVLTGLTFVGGLVWAWIYQREPNLFTLSISHTICSLVASICLPPALINNLRVGFKYFG